MAGVDSPPTLSVFSKPSVDTAGHREPLLSRCGSSFHEENSAGKHRRPDPRNMGRCRARRCAGTGLPAGILLCLRRTVLSRAAACLSPTDLRRCAAGLSTARSRGRLRHRSRDRARRFRRWGTRWRRTSRRGTWRRGTSRGTWWRWTSLTTDRQRKLIYPSSPSASTGPRRDRAIYQSSRSPFQLLPPPGRSVLRA
jgi:hypothetical protein